VVSGALRVFKNQVAIQVEQVRIDLLHQLHFAKDPGVLLTSTSCNTRGLAGGQKARPFVLATAAVPSEHKGSALLAHLRLDDERLEQVRAVSHLGRQL
jgi:hypothetical protein